MTRSWYGQTVQDILFSRPALGKAALNKALAERIGATRAHSLALDYLIDFMVYAGLLVVDENSDLRRRDYGGAEERPISHGPNAKLSLIIHLHVNKLEDLTPENANRVAEWLKGLRESVHPLEVKLETKEA